MPNTPQTWLSQTLVPSSSSGADVDPQIVQLANGNVLIAWSAYVGTGYDILGRIYDPFGTQISAELTLDSGNGVAGNQDSPAITALADGGFILALHEHTTSGFDNLYLRQFNASGTSTTRAALALDTATANALPLLYYPEIAVSSPTSAMAIYQYINASADSVVLGRIWNPTTQTFTGSSFTVFDNAASGDYTWNDITALSNGNYVAVASFSDNVNFYTQVKFGIFNSSGTVVQAVTDVSSVLGATSGNFDPSVTALTGGGFVIAFRNQDPDDVDVHFAVYAANGSLIASPTVGAVAAGSSVDDNNEPEVVALADGGFIVFYDDDGSAAPGIRGERFDASGALVGSNFLVAAGEAPTQPSATLLADGRVQVVYAVDGEVFTKIIDTRDLPSLGDMTLAGAAHDYVVGTIGADVIDTASYASGVTTFNAWDGDDIIYATESVGRSIFAGAGNDTVYGGSGADTLNGGTGTDMLDYSSDTAGVAVRLWNNSASGGKAAGDVITGFEGVTGGSGNDTINGDTGDNVLIGNAGKDFLFALDGNDILFGGAGSDSLYGGAGNDTVNGGDGNDVIYGDAGADVLSGGAGIDTLTYSSDTAGVAIRLWNNTASGGDAAGDVISGFENVSGGSANDTINGDNSANVLIGNNGNDFLFALSGDDSLFGGFGNDTIYGGFGNDSVEGGAGADDLRGEAGIDTVSYADDTTGVAVRLWNNTASGGDAAGDVISGFENVTGGSGNDTINGDNFVNVLIGNAGNDFLFALGGNDSLVGGAGNDSLYGGTGDDTLQGDDGNDVIYGDAGADVLSGGAGTDLLNYGADTVGVAVRLWNNTASGGDAAGDIISGFEDVSGGSGNDTINGDNGANVLTGNDGNDFLFALGGDDNLFGGAGNDSIYGGNGNDTIYGGAGADDLRGEAGIDTISYADSLSGVAVRLWNNTATGGDATGDVISGFENVTGGSGNDTINGDNGANVLIGNNGNDILFAVDGADTVYGGLGNDTIYGGGGADVFVFEASNGIDRVVDFALAQDQLQISSSLTAGNMDEASVVATYASVIGTDVVFDFGSGNTITLNGLTSTAGLDADILIF